MYTGSLPLASNRADFIFDAQIIDDETDEAIDLSTSTIVAEIRDDRDCVCIAATTDNGLVVLTDAGLTFRVSIPRSTMTGLCAGTYQFGLTIESNDITTQIYAGTLPIIDGVVPR